MENSSAKKHPISEIVALDAKHDIALLKAEGYVPQSFYPPARRLASAALLERISIPGFLGGRKFIVLTGKSSGPSNYDLYQPKSSFGFTIDNHRIIISGMSGSPVFSFPENHLVGVLIEGKVPNKGGPVGLNLFTSVERLYDLLEKPSLSCASLSCVKEEWDILKKQAEAGDRQAQYKLAGPLSIFKNPMLEKAAKNGHPNAQFIIGLRDFYFDDGNTYWLEASAAQDHPPAKDFLERISKGIITPKGRCQKAVQRAIWSLLDGLGL